jgi:two-component system C4-dicarboxylate transport sensor histidine kinase DctB
MNTPNPSSLTPPEPPVARLAAKVAHELNNPLDAVLRLVSLAQRKHQSGAHADVERHLADAQTGLQRMTEILRELMDLGRQTHEVALQSQQVALADLLTQATRSIALQAEQKHVSLAVDTEDSGNGPRFDLRLSQVLTNLLKNAVDATPEGSTVRLAARTDLQGFAITVEDAGPGIDPNLLPRLFTPFLTTKPRGQGHGLGLAISRDLVLSLGGTLTLKNRPEGGCIAGIWLPRP